MKPQDVDPHKLLKRAMELARKGVSSDNYHIPFDIELGINELDKSDCHIMIDNIHGVYWSDETVVPLESFAGAKLSEERQQFIVFRIESDPGVMYHPDGSGTPPSEEWVDIGEPHDTFERAFTEAIKLAVENRIIEFLTYEDENKLADEMEFADYVQDLESVSHENAKAFRDIFSRGMLILDLKESEIAHAFDTSRPTIRRWKKGESTPHPRLIKHVYDFLKRKAATKHA